MKRRFKPLEGFDARFRVLMLNHYALTVQPWEYVMLYEDMMNNKDDVAWKDYDRYLSSSSESPYYQYGVKMCALIGECLLMAATSASYPYARRWAKLMHQEKCLFQ